MIVTPVQRSRYRVDKMFTYYSFSQVMDLWQNRHYCSIEARGGEELARKYLLWNLCKHRLERDIDFIKRNPEEDFPNSLKQAPRTLKIFCGTQLNNFYDPQPINVRLRLADIKGSWRVSNVTCRIPEYKRGYFEQTWTDVSLFGCCGFYTDILDHVGRCSHVNSLSKEDKDGMLSTIYLYKVMFINMNKGINYKFLEPILEQGVKGLLDSFKNLDYGSYVDENIKMFNKIGIK